MLRPRTVIEEGRSTTIKMRTPNRLRYLETRMDFRVFFSAGFFFFGAGQLLQALLVAAVHGLAQGKYDAHHHKDQGRSVTVLRI